MLYLHTMKKPSLAIVFMVFHLCIITHVYAQIKLPAIVANNMVLQRNTEVTLWGWATPNSTVHINCSWIKTNLKCQTNNKGYWQIPVVTTNSKSAQFITLKNESDTKTLQNILFGEVWLCSGQSNMFQPLKGYTGQPTFGGRDAILNAKNTNLRLFSVNKVASKSPLNNLENTSTWQEASPQEVANFSAIGYFFGEKLQEVLDVPVGIIHSSWGGSKIEAWFSKSALKEFQKIKIPDFKTSKRKQFLPTVLYNGMIHPILNYKIKGVLWYQGESNRKHPEAYLKLFPALVKNWRSLWNIGDFPFYYVQIAPYLYEGNTMYTPDANTAFFREVQLKCLDKIPNSGIAITLDLGQPNYIHPPQKKEVAYRLLYNALNQTYGYSAIAYTTPTFATKSPKNNGLLLNFNNAKEGLFAFTEWIEGFEIAGEDKVFYPAAAKITNRTSVFVQSPNVPHPVAARYAWRNWTKATLFNTNLLPVSSFRTDHWNDATHIE